MKKLLLLLVLFSWSSYSQEFTTTFPETIHWKMKNGVLYNLDGGIYRKKVNRYIEPGTNDVIWFINFPDYNMIYTVRIVGDKLNIIKSRKT